MKTTTKNLRQELSSVRGGFAHLKETAQKEISHLRQETLKEVRSQHLKVSGILQANAGTEAVLRSKVERLEADLSAYQQSATTETKQVHLALSEAKDEVSSLQLQVRSSFFFLSFFLSLFFGFFIPRPPNFLHQSIELKTNVDALESEMQDLAEKNFELQSELGVAKGRVEELTQELATREAQVSSLRGGKGAQEQQLEDERAARKKVEQTLQEMQTQLDQADDDNLMLKEESKSLKESSDSEIKQLKVGFLTILSRVVYLSLTLHHFFFFFFVFSVAQLRTQGGGGPKIKERS